MIVKRHDTLSRQERLDLETMFNYLPELRALRDFVDRLGRVFEQEQSEPTAWRRRAALISDPTMLAVPELAQEVTMLGPEKFARMIAFLTSPVYHRVRTNNHVERVNRKLRRQEKARYKWRKRRTLVRFLVLLMDRYWRQERAARNRWPEETESGTEDQASFKTASKHRAA